LALADVAGEGEEAAAAGAGAVAVGSGDGSAAVSGEDGATGSVGSTEEGAGATSAAGSSDSAAVAGPGDALSFADGWRRASSTMPANARTAVTPIAATIARRAGRDTPGGGFGTVRTCASSLRDAAPSAGHWKAGVTEGSETGGGVGSSIAGNDGAGNGIGVGAVEN
jgi:hypothetical protein